ncbi:MAG: hypothetical protein IH994_04040 [Proteobacteria bacterium]|nr:hypothetical protein [Pseudomonadota bacterium]
MNRRKALKTVGAALAVFGAAMLPAMAKGKRPKSMKQAVPDRETILQDFRRAISELETYDGAATCGVVVDRLMFAGRMRQIIGEDVDFLTLSDGRTIPVSKHLSEWDREKIVSIEGENQAREKSMRENGLLS